MRDVRIIHLDLDGVLVALDEYIWDKAELKFGMYPAKEMWAQLRENCYDMFLNAKPLPDAVELVNHVMGMQKYGFRVEVLTAVPLFKSFPDAKAHKKQWLRNHFPELVDGFKIGPFSRDKWKHARMGDILIDDRPLNIEQWREAGGIGILHTSTAETIKDLDGAEHQWKKMVAA